MRERNRKSIEIDKMLPQFTTMNVIEGQAGLVNYSSLIFYSLTLNNILNIIILLILAGIGLGAIAEKDSLVKNAQETADEYERAAGEEADTVNDLLNILP